MPTHTIHRSYQMGNAASVGPSISLTYDGEAHAGPVTVTFAAPDVQVDIGIPFATLKALFIFSDSDTNLTIETNSATVLDDVILISANAKSYCWTYNDGGPDTAMPNPLSADVTKLFFTKATSGSCTVEVFALYDATP